MDESAFDPHNLRRILSPKERAELRKLLGEIISDMRLNLERGFNLSSEEIAEGALASSNRQQTYQNSVTPRGDLTEPRLRKLKYDALAHFDSWQDSVVRCVMEVLNGTDSSPQKPLDIVDGDSSQEDFTDEDDGGLKKHYPPVITPLTDLSKAKRILIVNYLLLIILSLKKYSALSRVLLLNITSSLSLPLSALTSQETLVTTALMTAAKVMSADKETQKRSAENRSSRMWKVGLASVAGAAIVGVTGGLAAPIVASGIGAIMGGIGLGAVGGIIGTIAGSGALMGSLFGYLGGQMTGKMMDAYAKEVEDFKFMPVKNGSASDDAEENSRRLRVVIGISGWLTTEEDIVGPWKNIGDEAEVFALRYELHAMLDLGTALKDSAESRTWNIVKFEILKRTVFASMIAAMWPVVLLQMATALDNPFSLAKARSEKAGEILADALMNRAQGERPVTLIGYSLGARVIYTCLTSLAKQRAFGLIESVVFIGSPVPSQGFDWRIMKAAVAGKIINVYSENDYILGFLYRTSSIQFGVAGLQPIKGVSGVENVDVSTEISGHLRYPRLMGSLLRKIDGAGVRLDDEDEEAEHIQLIDADTVQLNVDQLNLDAKDAYDSEEDDGPLQLVDNDPLEVYDEPLILVDHDENEPGKMSKRPL